MRLTAILGITLLANSFTGCVSLPDYPSTWANIQETEKNMCPVLSGTYRNKGDNGAEKKDTNDNYITLNNYKPSPWLMAILFKDVSEFIDPELKKTMTDHDIYIYDHTITHLTFLGPKDGSLQITLWIGDKIVSTKLLSKKNDYTCKKNSILLKPKFAADGTTGIGLERGSASLYIATDKSLVVREKATGAGVAFALMVPIPYAMVIGEWSRFSYINIKE